MMSIRLGAFVVFGGLLVGLQWPVVATAQEVPPLQGCTNPSAINFTAGATIDNGSCVVLPPFPTFPVIPAPTPVPAGTVTITNPPDRSTVADLEEIRVTFEDNSPDATNIATYQVIEGTCASPRDGVASDLMASTSGGFVTVLDPEVNLPGMYCVRVTVLGSNSSETSVSVAHDFEIVAPIRLQTVSGQKYEDVDDDGRLNYELDRLVADYPIIATNNETGETFTTTTDEDGTYSFALPDGVWTISEGDKRGWGQIRAYYGWVLIDEGDDELVSQTCTFTLGEEFDDEVRSREIPRRGKGNACVFLNEQVSTGGSSTGTKVGVRSRSSVAPRVLGIATTTTATTTTATTPAIKCEGMYLTSYLREGQENPTDQVLKLQVFLNAIGITTSMTGSFDATTTEAVRTFQVKYLAEVLRPWSITTGTGYVFKTTRATINNMVCPGSEVVPAL